jgi:hypothetical protein
MTDCTRIGFNRAVRTCDINCSGSRVIGASPPLQLAALDFSSSGEYKYIPDKGSTQQR